MDKPGMSNKAKVDAAVDEVGRVLLGKESQVRLALCCLLADGHLLIEDMPGMGKTPKLEEGVDPDLIGGLVLQVADRRIDTSVFKEIKGLRQQLLDRASQEIHSGKTYLEEAS